MCGTRSILRAAMALGGRLACPQGAARFVVGWAILGLLCTCAGSSRAATIYVSPAGDDSGPGTEAKPLATVQKAAETAQAGDEVVVREGVYRITREIRPRNSGTAEKWIVYRAPPGEKAIIDADAFTQAEPGGVPPSRRQLGAIHLENISYIRVENLTVCNAHFVCFNVMGPKTHHVELHGCRADRSYGPGIFLRGGPEYCRVIGCEVTGANDPQLRTAGERVGREAPHEAISIAWATHFEIAENHVHHCIKEGIDCKEQSAHGVIHHNRVHDCQRQGLYADCWFGLLEDVEFHSNLSYNNEWGLVISAEGRGARMENVRIHHNLLYNNRGSGLYFGTWGVNGPRSDISIYNNTIYHNGRDKHWAGGTGGIDLRAEDLRRISVVNNIVFDNAAWEIATFAAPDKRDEILKAKEIVIANNLTGPFRDLSSEGGAYNRPYAYRGEQTIEADPKFADPKAGDFRLQAGSPAIGAARKLIPFQTGPDLGAFAVAGQVSVPQGPRMPEEIPVVDGDWWQIATEAYDAGEFSNKPAPGESVKREHQQVSDFTIYKAADGSWQLVSAVRSTRFPGGRHFLFRWQGRSLADTKWEPKGIFWTTAITPAAGYKEGIIYAPHCFVEDGTYYMFHNSAGTALVLTSKDGQRFEQAKDHAGSYTFFPTGEAGRDLMVLDNRRRDGLWYAFYTSIDRTRPELKGRQFSDVFARTTKNLRGPWSEPFAVGVGTPNRPEQIVHAKYDFVNTESSFVLHRQGFYYKFEQTNVVASDDLRHFEGKPIVSTLYPSFQYPEQWWPALAPEVIADGDQYYVAVFKNHGAGPLGSGGVFVAKLKWVRRSPG